MVTKQTNSGDYLKDNSVVTIHKNPILKAESPNGARLLLRKWRTNSLLLVSDHGSWLSCLHSLAQIKWLQKAYYNLTLRLNLGLRNIKEVAKLSLKLIMRWGKTYVDWSWRNPCFFFWYFLLLLLQVDLITTITKLSCLGQKINYEAYTYPIKKIELSKLKL